jgi:hypothetical protein
VIVKQETKQNKTKQAETKRDTTETKQDKAETKPNQKITNKYILFTFIYPNKLIKPVIQHCQGCKTNQHLV